MRNHLPFFAIVFVTILASFHPMECIHREHKVHNIVLYPDKHSWCQTQQIKQVISYPGCKSEEIDNNVCVGACFSYSIPHTEPSDPGEVIVPYCDSCQPSDITWHHITLQCEKSNETPPQLVKRVQIINNCSCSSCEGSNGRHKSPANDVSDTDDTDDFLMMQQNEIPDLLRALNNRNETFSYTVHDNSVHHSDSMKSIMNHRIVTLLKDIQEKNSRYDKEQLADVLRAIQSPDNHNKISDEKIADFVESLNSENVELDLVRLREVLKKFEHSKYMEKHRKYLLGNVEPATVDAGHTTGEADVHSDGHHSHHHLHQHHHQQQHHINIVAPNAPGTVSTDEDTTADEHHRQYHILHHHKIHHDGNDEDGDAKSTENTHHRDNVDKNMLKYENTADSSSPASSPSSSSSSTATEEQQSPIVKQHHDDLVIDSIINHHSIVAPTSSNLETDPVISHANDTAEEPQLNHHHHNHHSLHQQHHHHHHHRIGEEIHGHGHLIKGPNGALVIEHDDQKQIASPATDVREKLDVNPHELKPNHAGTLLSYSGGQQSIVEVGATADDVGGGGDVPEKSSLADETRIMKSSTSSDGETVRKADD